MEDFGEGRGTSTFEMIKLPVRRGEEGAVPQRGPEPAS